MFGAKPGGGPLLVFWLAATLRGPKSPESVMQTLVAVVFFLYFKILCDPKTSGYHPILLGYAS